MAGISRRSNHSKVPRQSASSNVVPRTWGRDRPIVVATVSRRRAAASGIVYQTSLDALHEGAEAHAAAC